ncbi:uncharacterized protein LOC127008521 [Eriocheir sinensis]|uniref:uncharacterized protein LOC127008521 n=1 Tax=Eriocheir sinensis TaxID=95602 RepID=UPI0021C7E258|nr:uncharacterized protein LOC127008521 [Eriocheir sinensis]
MVLPSQKNEKTYLLPGSWWKGKNLSTSSASSSPPPPPSSPPMYGGVSSIAPSIEDIMVCSGEHGRAKRGLGLLLTSFFLVAQVAGLGVLALPWAVAQTGWLGLVLVAAVGVCVGVCGCHLGTCWCILEERWPEYQRACRKPYPAMAFRTLGWPGWYTVNVVQCVTLFGVSIVTILLSAELLESVFTPVLPKLTMCSWVLVCGAVLVPLSWLGTPREFWHVSVLALVAAVAAVLVVIIKILVETPVEEATHASPTAHSFFLGLGTIMFSFGGAVVFPTIQNDMSDRSKFPLAIMISFCALLLMYLPMAALGYLEFGSGVQVNVLLMVHGPSVTAVEVLMFVNNLFTYVLIINPFSQSLEEAASLPTRFGWRRSILRTSLVVAGVLVGLAVKNFGRILNLIGSFSVPLLTFVLPPIFYIRLCDSKERSDWPERSIAPPHRLALWLVVALGAGCSLVATWTALEALLDPSDSSLSCFD